MKFDVENELGLAQAFTGSATVSTNSYQKQSAAQDLSIGRRISVVFYFSAAGAGTTHTLSAIQADNAALTSNKEVLASRDITTADLKLGYPYAVEFPQGSMDKQFLGAQHAASGGTTTATCDIYIMPSDEVEMFKTFPKSVHAEVQ